MARLVSATWPASVRQLASTFQRDPYRITVGSEELTANGRVEQGKYDLRNLFNEPDIFD